MTTVGHVITRGSRFATLLAAGLRAADHARRAGLPGLAFGSVGRRMGFQAALAGRREGPGMMLTPVSIVRYWEFPFALRHLQPRVGQALDVASPRLFSFFMADRGRAAHIRVLNPDLRDARSTAALARALRLPGIEVEARPVAAIDGTYEAYDAIWSISVIEHIPADGDIEAVSLMWKALRPGGRMILTVPTDRHAWVEHRERDEYRLDVPRTAEGYFFQRWYDRVALDERILATIGTAPTAVEWFGERVPGHYRQYEQDWMVEGPGRTVDDPREIVDHYRAFPDWADMPGQGVVGLAFTKSDSPAGGPV